MWDRVSGQTPMPFLISIWTLITLLFASTDGKFPNEIIEPPIVACEPDRIVIKVRTTTSNPSHIYAEDFHESPKCTVKNQNQIAIPHAECGMTTEHMDNPAGTMFRICISVQIHPFFVTDADQSYCAQCVYMEANVVDDLAQSIAISEMTPNELEPQFDETSNPHCTYSIRKDSVDGSEVHAAVVGDNVFHVWQCDNDNVGILVQNCHVEDLQGDKILIIDQNGCGVDQYLFRTPEYTEDLSTAFLESNVFKFVDKAMTRFRCQLRLCVKRRGQGCEGITPPNSCPRFEEDEDGSEIEDKSERFTTTTTAKTTKNNKKNNNSSRMKSKGFPEPENRIDGDAAVVGSTTVATELASSGGDSKGGPGPIAAGVITEIGRDGTTRGTAPSSLRPPPPYHNSDFTATAGEQTQTQTSWTWSTDRPRPMPTRQLQNLLSPPAPSASPSQRGHQPSAVVDYSLSDTLSFDTASAARAFIVADANAIPATTASTHQPEAIGPPSIRPFALSSSYLVSGRTNGIRARDAPPSTTTTVNGTVVVRHDSYTVNRGGSRAARPPAYAPPSHSPSSQADGHQSGYMYRHRNRRFATVHANATIAHRVIAKRAAAAPRATAVNGAHELDVVGLIRVLDNPEDLEYYTKEQSPEGDSHVNDSRLHNMTVAESSTTTTIVTETNKTKSSDNDLKQQKLRDDPFVVMPEHSEQKQIQQNYSALTVAKRANAPVAEAADLTAANVSKLQDSSIATATTGWLLTAGAGGLALIEATIAGLWLALSRPAVLRWRQRVYELAGR